MRKSILDVVGERTTKLVGALGASDKRKMDEYLTAVREIEKRIQNAEKDQREFTPSIEKPAGIPPVFAEYAKTMYDLQVLAFQADLTRVSTFMIGREGSVRTYPELGVNDPHHPMSHHRNMPEDRKSTRLNSSHSQISYAVFCLK